MMNAKTHIEILRDELSKRMSNNPQYSLRAFARDLTVSPQQLCNVMNGRKGMSGGMALAIADRLQFTQGEKDYFCNLVQSQFARSQLAKDTALKRLNELKSDRSQATTVVSISSTDLPRAQKMIDDFWKNLASEIPANDGASDSVALSIQMVNIR